MRNKIIFNFPKHKNKNENKKNTLFNKNMKNQMPKNQEEPDLATCHKVENQKHFLNFPKHKNKNENKKDTLFIKT